MLSTHSAVASRLEIHQSLASLSSLNLHRGLPSVRLRSHAQLHNIHSVYSVWTKKCSNTLREKKRHILEQEFGGTNIHGAETHSHMHRLLPSSELIHSCYSNIKVIKHAVRGKNGRQIQRMRKTEEERHKFGRSGALVYFSLCSLGHCCVCKVVDALFFQYLVCLRIYYCR